jgi:hypothetical protein
MVHADKSSNLQYLLFNSEGRWKNICTAQKLGKPVMIFRLEHYVEWEKRLKITSSRLVQRSRSVLFLDRYTIQVSCGFRLFSGEFCSVFQVSPDEYRKSTFTYPQPSPSGPLTTHLLPFTFTRWHRPVTYSDKKSVVK